MDCGLPIPLLDTVSVALRAPDDVGSNTTLTVHVLFTTSAPLQVDDVTGNSLELLVTELTIAVAVPMLRIVSAMAALGTSSVCVPKLADGGTDRLGCAGALALPVPVSATVSGLGVPLSMIVNVLERLPVSEGLKSTSTVQL